MKIIIVDYDMGNIAALRNAIEYLNYNVKVSKNPKDISSADFLIIPGVGAFKQAIKNIKNMNLFDQINDYIFIKKKYFLGICLGMQLLCEESEEHGKTSGFKCVNLKLKKFKTKPNFHIGYNQVNFESPNTLFKNIKQNSDFYFVHSFRVKNSKLKNYTKSTSEYGEKFISSFEKDNIFGTQFHPEKSQMNGLKLIKNFLSQ